MSAACSVQFCQPPVNGVQASAFADDMCEGNSTGFLTYILREVKMLASDGVLCGSATSSDCPERISVLLTYLKGLLLSSALPGLLMLLSWLLWLMYYASFRSKASQLPLPPGSMGLPLIGETLTFYFMGSTFYKKRRKLYGDVFKTHLLGCPIVRVVGSSNVRKILMGENTLVTSFWPSSVRTMLGDNTISISTGNRHRFLRKGVARAFNHSSLASYVPVMQERVRDAIGRWCDAAFVRGYRECRLLAFNVACNALLGLGRHGSAPEGGSSAPASASGSRLSSSTAAGSPRGECEKLLDVFETWINNLFSLPIKLPWSGLSRGLRARKILLGRIEECIRAKETEENMTSSRGGGDALWLMMQLGEDGSRLSIEELKEVCLELLFAGHATVASASSSLFYFLGRNPRVVKRILKELEDHGLRDSQDDDLTFDAVSKLTYVGHVVKEVLRLAPPVGAGFRKALKTFEVDGYQVPKGWMVVYSIRETQAFSELFTDADCFEPERWEGISLSPGPGARSGGGGGPGNSASTNDAEESSAFHFLPFGWGTRSCVGKEYAKLLLKVLTVEACRSCRWRLLNEGAEIKVFPVPHAADGLPMHVSYHLPAHVRPRAATV